MPPKRKKKATPLINRLSDEGLSRWEILDRLDGAKNRRVLDRRQYEAMGFQDWRVDRFMTGDSKHQTAWQRGKARPGNERPDGLPHNENGPIGKDPEAAFNQSAFDVMRGLLKQYGLESLADRLRDLITSGVEDQASITLALQDTKEWKERFIGNEALRNKGLPVLSVAEYLATERSYGQIMKNFGLPQGFYDDPADFGKFIGAGVSASELQERVSSFADLANREDPAVRQQLASMGLGQGDLLAFMMDPERANPLIQKKYKTALIGAAARRTGLTTDNAYAARLAGMGITEQQAQAGYSLISESLGDAQKLGDIYGEQYGQRDFESEVFEGDGESTKKRKRLASQERAAFSGQSGVGQGSLRQSSAGQY